MFQHHNSTHRSPASGHGSPRHAQDAGKLAGEAHASTAAADRRHRGASTSLNRVAVLATLHCLSGCAVGEVLGMVIGTAWGLSNGSTIALAIALAFAFGYAFTMLPLLRHGIAPRQALRLALAADTASIAIMEMVDNLAMLIIPGAMNAPLDSFLFWGALAAALVVAGVAAFPVNRWLIARGRGHAVMHAFHRHA